MNFSNPKSLFGLSSPLGGQGAKYFFSLHFISNHIA